MTQTLTNNKGGVTFPCPQCGTPITRSQKERVIMAQYKCKCGFVGPN